MASLFPIPTNTTALQAFAIDGEVVLKSTGLGLPICLSLTPDAVLASLEPLRLAAQEALTQSSGDRVMSSDDIIKHHETFSVGASADDGGG